MVRGANVTHSSVLINLSSENHAVKHETKQNSTMNYLVHLDREAHIKWQVVIQAVKHFFKSVLFHRAFSDSRLSVSVPASKRLVRAAK